MNKLLSCAKQSDAHDEYFQSYSRADMGTMGAVFVYNHYDHCFSILLLLFFNERAAAGQMASPSITCMDAFLFVLYRVPAEGKR